MRRKPKINFCSFRKQSKWSDICRAEMPDVDSLHDRFIDGIDVWIIQSYLIFKAAKLPFEVLFSDEIMADAVNILHRDEIHLKRNLHRGFILGIRADRPPLYMADLTVCQNRSLRRKNPWPLSAPLAPAGSYSAEPEAEGQAGEYRLFRSAGKPRWQNLGCGFSERF